jgi:hypothetical protein
LELRRNWDCKAYYLYPILTVAFVVVWCPAADCWEMPGDVEVRSRTVLSPTAELTGLVNEGRRQFVLASMRAVERRLNGSESP